jgi:hypothetical protein
MGRQFMRQGKKQEQRDELLSAYLDGQLSAAEQARLEAQLAADPALQAELDALRYTVALVRDLPPVPSPRNFILSQTATAQPRPAPSARFRHAWTAPLLTAATAVASLLFVVVLAGDLLFARVGGLALAPAAEPLLESEALREALPVSPVAQEVEAGVEAEAEKMVPAPTPLPMPMEAPQRVEPTVAVEAESYDAEMEEGGEATVPAADGEPAEEPAAPLTPGPAMPEEAIATPTVQGTVSLEQAMGAGSPTEEPAALAPTPRLAVAEGVTAIPADLVTMTPTPGADVGSAEPSPPLVKEEKAGEEVESAEDERDVPGSVAGISLWRVLEVLLGLTVLGLALVTVWAWRVRR